MIQKIKRLLESEVVSWTKVVSACVPGVFDVKGSCDEQGVGEEYELNSSSSDHAGNSGD